MCIRDRGDKMNKKNGFTLIELMCTILLLSIIVSLVIITTVNIIQNSKERENAASMKLIEVAAKDYITQNENDKTVKVEYKSNTYFYSLDEKETCRLDETK